MAKKEETIKSLPIDKRVIDLGPVQFQTLKTAREKILEGRQVEEQTLKLIAETLDIRGEIKYDIDFENRKLIFQIPK